MVEQWASQAIAFIAVNWQIVVGIIVLLLVGSGLLQDLRARENVLQAKLELMQKSLQKEMTGIRTMAEEQSVRDREVFQVGLYNFNESVARIMGDMNRTQQAQFDTFSGQLHATTRVTEEQVDTVKGVVDERLGRFADMLNESMGTQGQRLEEVSRRLDQSVTDSGQLMNQVQGTLERHLQQMRVSNQQQMRQLQTMPDRKLIDTCLNVSVQLDQAAKGLSDLQLMAGGSLDVGRVLEHLKTRGPWAEVEAEELLDAVLSVAQYRAQIAVRPQSTEKADFAVLLPSAQSGASEEERPVYLPILTGFPAQENQLLMRAIERQDTPAAEAAVMELSEALSAQAQRIGEAFVEPPFTTEYAILYLPSEGLYAQMVQDSTLREQLQQRFRVLLSGPSTMASLLGSLQAGLRARAMEQRVKELRAALSKAREKLEALCSSQSRSEHPEDQESDAPKATAHYNPQSLLEIERRRFEQLYGGGAQAQAQPPEPPAQSIRFAYDEEPDKDDWD